MTNYYLYRHIRLDKNIPFYIGIGTKSKLDKRYNYYTRANSLLNRNNFWKNIVKKTDYRVDIILESDDYEFIKSKEIEFIKLYGRSNLGLGPLCNLTDGGEGTTGIIISEITRKKLSESHKGIPNKYKGIPLSKEWIEKLKEGHKNRGYYPKPTSELNKKILYDINRVEIYQYDINGNFIREFESIAKAALETNSRSSLIIKVLKNYRKIHNNFIWKYKKDYKNIFNINPYIKKPLKKVLQFDLNNNFIKEYISINEAALQNNYKKGSIMAAANGSKITYNKFVWKYKEDINA